MKIIVNADDFALEPIRDKAIVECFHRGWISQTTAVMNRPGLENARELAMREKLMGKIGLHINLIYDKPLTDEIRKFPLFCDSEGKFNAAFHMSSFTRLYLSRSIKEAVAREVRAQICKYKKFGFTLMHADSHQHSHTDFAITPLLVDILKTEGFRSLRIARNLGEGMSFLKRQYKRLFNSYLRHRGMAFTDYFGSIHDYLTCRNQLADDACVELMCHPMFTIGTADREDGVLTDFYKPFDPNVMNSFHL